MARLSIYVPDELKERIDALKSEANWSDVACRAFEINIGELAKARKETDMSAVIERLRASKLQNEDKMTQAGREAGRRWAQKYAEYDELQRVCALDADEWCIGQPMAPHTHGGWLALHTLGLKEDGDDSHVREFAECAGWDDVFPHERGELEDEGFISGFILGAQEFFDEVADKL